MTSGSTRREGHLDARRRNGRCWPRPCGSAWRVPRAQVPNAWTALYACAVPICSGSCSGGGASTRVQEAATSPSPSLHALYGKARKRMSCACSAALNARLGASHPASGALSVSAEATSGPLPAAAGVCDRGSPCGRAYSTVGQEVRRPTYNYWCRQDVFDTPPSALSRHNRLTQRRKPAKSFSVCTGHAWRDSSNPVRVPPLV